LLIFFSAARAKIIKNALNVVDTNIMAIRVALKKVAGRVPSVSGRFATLSDWGVENTEASVFFFSVPKGHFSSRLKAMGALHPPTLED